MPPAQVFQFLSEKQAALLAPLFEILSLQQAMPELLPRQSASSSACAIVNRLCASEGLSGLPCAQSALWLYVDDLDESHAISQSVHTATGSFLHGIMHRREGDFWNSHYWMRQARRHAVWSSIPGYDPDAFIDAVAAAGGKNPDQLLALQRAEWEATMAWCLGRNE